jgi:hypothetical protein
MHLRALSSWPSAIREAVCVEVVRVSAHLSARGADVVRTSAPDWQVDSLETTAKAHLRTYVLKKHHVSICVCVMCVCACIEMFAFVRRHAGDQVDTHMNLLLTDAASFVSSKLAHESTVLSSAPPNPVRIRISSL